MSDNPVFVTEPFLPDLEDFIPYLEEIWKSKRLTNSGMMHQQLEVELADYLGVPQIVLFNNGTNALLAALQVLDVRGEVITTPYSFIATSHSIVWNNLTPVFVDIEPDTLNIDPERIESAITGNTVAILPVHCYGNPCDINRITQIAEKYELKVVYDAAHAFGVRDKCGSILSYGDLSVLSFHATKVFNTFEGGAVVCKDVSTKNKIERLKNFGIVDELAVESVGINGKMSEVHAAFGLLQLKYMPQVLSQRAEVDRYYREGLKFTKGIRMIEPNKEIQSNYSYFPILVENAYPLSRDELYEKMKVQNIFARRYFYPLITSYPMYSSCASASVDNLPVANRVAQQVLALPIFPGISMGDLNSIISLIDNPYS